MSTGAVDPTSWGTVAEWVAAIGTVGALFFALATIRFEVRDRRADAARERKSQARRVVFDNTTTLSAARIDDKTIGRPFTLTVGVQVTNYSDMPIYWVQAKIVTGGHEDLVNVSTLIPPGEARGVSSSVAEVEPDEPVPLLSLLFVDARGVAWAREAATSDVVEAGGRGRAPVARVWPSAGFRATGDPGTDHM